MDNRNKRRLILGNCIKTSLLPLVWAAPIVQSIILPAHATTSECKGTLWQLEVTYLEFKCWEYGLCWDLNPDLFGPIVPPEHETKQFCLTSAELSAGGFTRDIDMDGNGPSSDYIVMRYIIENQINLSMSGTVTTFSVDTGVGYKGVWEAIKL